MTKTDVIRMAEECELFDGIWSHPELKELKADKFIKFANLAAAIERDACAELMDEMDAKDNLSNYYKVAANKIRARGNNDV